MCRLIACFLKQFTAFRLNQQGAIAPFMVFGIAGVLFASSYAIDTTRMTTDAAQIKRATDAAAIAIGEKKLTNSAATNDELLTTAIEYVRYNLGMDSALSQTIRDDQIAIQVAKTGDGLSTYTVSVDFNPVSSLLHVNPAAITIASTAEDFDKPAEIALVLPNTLTEDATNLAALRRLGNEFAKKLIGETAAQKQENIWLSVVPYSQSVNVYDSNDTNRIRRWAAPNALNPVELTSLFSSGKASSLADNRIPDRKANLLCMYRGLAPGANYYWDQAPASQFRLYYRADLPENGSPGADPISWVGPNPTFGAATGVNDVRWMVADRGCPHAALLPLTDDLTEIETRLDAMTTQFNVNYAIAMGWGAMALSPEMRGTTGWGDEKLPLDFAESDDKTNVKAIVMMGNTTGNWFDTDAYNAFTNSDGVVSETTNYQPVTERFKNLCASLKAHHVHFYFIGVRPGDPNDFGRTLFGQVAVPALQTCTDGSSAITFADADDFASGETDIKDKLDDIADDIKSKRSYVRLVR